MTSSTPQSAPSSAAARALRATMRGNVLAANDIPYDSARRVWNGAIDRRPAVIARCEDEQDVAAAIRAAREHDLALSVRGGGHDWAGRAITDGGVVLDLSKMRGVHVDPATRTADVAGGIRIGDIVSGAHGYGLAAVTGTVNAVGMAGLTLAGGYGLLNGRYGLALDNLLRARVVLADGQSVTASAVENPDLYWALRGGGGNFGVVTSSRYRLHPLRSMFSGLMLFDLAQANTVLRGYRDLIAQAPDELTIMTGFFAGPDGQPLLFLLPAYLGEAAEGERILARLHSLGPAVSTQVGPMSYRDVVSQFDETIVDGRHVDVQTGWLPEFTDETIAIVVEAASRMTSPLSGLSIHHFHGAASRVPVADTAFALRRDHLLIEIIAAWVPSGIDNAHRYWSRSLSDALAPYALPGGYPNLLGPHDADRVRLAYGPNLSRLLDVKRAYDPQGVFAGAPSLPV